PPLLDELEDERRRVELADRAREEERVGGHGTARSQAEHAGGRLDDLVAVEDRELCTRYPMLRDQLREPRLEFLLCVHAASLPCLTYSVGRHYLQRRSTSSSRVRIGSWPNSAVNGSWRQRAIWQTATDSIRSPSAGWRKSSMSTSRRSTTTSRR